MCRCSRIIKHFSLIRLLDAALKETTLDWKELAIQRQANHCNDKKLAAKRVSQASDEMFLASFIKECGPYDVKGMVLKVRWLIFSELPKHRNDHKTCKHTGGIRFRSLNNH